MDKQLQSIKTLSAQRGMNMLELMLAMTIGLFLLLGLTTVFTNSSRTQRELEYTGQTIENARYAMDVVFQDVRLAGSYGYLVFLETPTALPTNVCSTANAVSDDAIKTPIQGFNTDASGTRASLGGNCGTLLADGNLKPGSDVLVVRRANTNKFTGAVTINQPYIQSNANDFKVRLGVSGAVVPTNTTDTDTADNDAAGVTLQYSTTPATIAHTRELETHVYFVAPCTTGLNAGGTAASTDGTCNGHASEDTVPTLKRLALTSDGANTVFTIEPLVEGVEFFQVEYGIDTDPSTVDATTGEKGDGIPDSFVTAPTAAQWPVVVATRIFMLVRSTNSSTGYTDAGTYYLRSTGVGTFSYGPPNDSFKRHVYSTEAQINNVAGRREIPI